MLRGIELNRPCKQTLSEQVHKRNELTKLNSLKPKLNETVQSEKEENETFITTQLYSEDFMPTLAKTPNVRDSRSSMVKF